MKGIIDLTIWQVLLSYVFVVIVLFIVKKRGIKREKAILLSSLRMTIQLVLTGYVLVYIFDHPSPLITIAIIILMECFAVYTVFPKIQRALIKKT
jgi:putative ABC transport system permease protein